MRIGIVSDTHGYYDPKIEKYFENCDEIWHAGDIGNLSVTDKLKEIGTLRGVFGNIDADIIRREFPLHQRFQVEGLDVWMTHIGGKPPSYDRLVREEINRNPPGLFVCGHSHICKVQMDKKLNMLYMNPGAAGVHGFHKIRTLLRFDILSGKVSNLEVIELGPRSLLSNSVD